MLNIGELETEKRNEKTMNLDAMSSLEIARVMNEEDKLVPAAIECELYKIAKAIDLCAESLLKGGRMIYIGAGTSGRLGVLDAVECPPTFGVSENTVKGILAGGIESFMQAKEGAEDDCKAAERDLQQILLSANDTLVGIAASGRTPYVISGMLYAQKTGCNTIAVVCNRDSEMSKICDIAIELLVGPEVLSGSTRLKSGTAQKLVLNMLSTGAMVKTGKVYQNLMVDVVQTNSKLAVRAQNIVMEATRCSRETAAAAIAQAKGSVKLAILMLLLNCSADEARTRLLLAGGFISNAAGSK